MGLSGSYDFTLARREIIKEARKVQRNATHDSMKYKDILELVRSLSDQFLD